MLLGLMTWALLAVTGAFVGLTTWFALRIVSQLDRMQQALFELERRIALLEMWREMMVMKRPVVRSAGTD